MKSKVFEEVDIKGKIIILSLIQEMERTVSFNFCNEIHDYFSKNYPQFYKKGETSFLTGYDGKVDFISGITVVFKEDETITLFKKEYFSPDDDQSACYRKYTCCNYLEGIKFVIPINFIRELHIY